MRGELRHIVVKCEVAVIHALIVYIERCVCIYIYIYIERERDVPICWISAQLEVPCSVLALLGRSRFLAGQSEPTSLLSYNKVLNQPGFLTRQYTKELHRDIYKEYTGNFI